MNKEFWKSKVFWTALLGFIAVVVNGAFGFAIPEVVIAGIIAVLTVIFRWSAEGPLKVK